MQSLWARILVQAMIYNVGLGLFEMATLTKPKPTSYLNLYKVENTGSVI